jgi:hypothetical protein
MIRFVLKKRRHTVSPSIRSFMYTRLTGAVAALWLCCAGPAWAGDGGADLASLNTGLGDLCSFLENNFSVPLPSCPQAPTITQGILQLASWSLVPNEMISAVNHIPLGQRVNAGSPSIPPVGPTPKPITAFPVTGPTLSTLLPNLTPLAFISSSPGPAAATQLYNTSADVFLYGVASLSNSSGQSVQPDTLYLLYDDTSRTNGNLQQGATVAEFSLPLVVLTGYIPPPGMSTPVETLVPTTLKFIVTNTGDCSASTVSGNFSGKGTQTLKAAQIGVNCAVVFAPSPLSAKSHAIFELAVPLVVTMATDPLYFGNPISNLEPVGFSFTTDETGFTPLPANPPILGANVPGANANSIGIGPAAVPLCTGLTCPPPTPPAPVSALCANLPGGNGNGQAPVPGVAAYYAITTVGETLLSAAVSPFSTSVCPF